MSYEPGNRNLGNFSVSCMNECCHPFGCFASFLYVDVMGMVLHMPMGVKTSKPK